MHDQEINDTLSRLMDDAIMKSEEALEELLTLRQRRTTPPLLITNAKVLYEKRVSVVASLKHTSDSLEDIRLAVKVKKATLRLNEEKERNEEQRKIHYVEPSSK